MEKHPIALPELRQLARKMRASGLSSIELHGKAWSVRLQYDPCLPPAGVAQQVTSDSVPPVAEPVHTAVCAPMPGKILLQHPLNNVAYVQPGQQVKQDDLLALVQVGSLYLPVTSPLDGTLAAISVTQGERVEYGREVALLSAAAAL